MTRRKDDNITITTTLINYENLKLEQYIHEDFCKQFFDAKRNMFIDFDMILCGRICIN